MEVEKADAVDSRVHVLGGDVRNENRGLAEAVGAITPSGMRRWLRAGARAPHRVDVPMRPCSAPDH
jgi:hypothetical protein